MPTNNYYGGQRLGDNLFANSVVALDCQSGERQWHFQTVHHGLWDYDLPAAPTLVDITIDGRPLKAVAQISKQGFTYVFDRITGEPVWPIEERAVPPSSVPGEVASPTQPFPTKPAPFEPQGISDATLIDYTPALRQEALQRQQLLGVDVQFVTRLEGRAGDAVGALDAEVDLLDRAEDLVHLADVRLVLQVDWRVEVRHLFVC